ncbi:MAG: hypothetical protein QOF37_2819 [Thermoleophilaceae bacterium]|nr:hypothetical protein [Thermoleophilaceae bacterium]
MIQPVETSSPQEAPQKTAAALPVDTSFEASSFADLHAAAVSQEKHAKTAVASKDATSPARERIAVPEGEEWEATKPGAHYARIVAGPRKGQCSNLTHGPRRGETFTIEQRGGKTVHVYTLSGKVVDVKASADAQATTNAAKHAKHPPNDHPRAGERWAPVAGAYNYADILGGPRNGLYVNTSGGVRDGMAFQIVKKSGNWFHVYGTGKDRQWIPSDGPKHKVHHTTPAAATSSAPGAGSTSASGAGTSSTGGTAAPAA